MAPPLTHTIDLTQDDESERQGSTDECNDPHHAVILHGFRKNILDQGREIQDLKESIEAKDRAAGNRQRRIIDLQARDGGRLAEIHRLEGEVTALRDRLNGRGKRQKRTWPRKLRAFVVDGARHVDYKTIHDLCCREENMSSSINFCHPMIRLGDTPNGWEPNAGHALGPNNDATFPNFSALPNKVQAQVFRLWLQKDRPIHCFSRLDPVTAPDSWPATDSSSGMYNRFYWGEERLLNLTEDTADPQEVLSLFLVSKAFYFKGVHAFYGLNTFAFSSIGEFGRFCKGIGLERAARLQHVELMWHGSQYLSAEHTFPINSRGKPVEAWDSLRTRPLSCFLDLRRLRTLAVFLNETSTLCVRRKYESPEVKAKLLDRTKYQPNNRRTRNLRALRGLDYIHALRGLDWVRFYDLWAMSGVKRNTFPELQPVRDTSFVADMNSTVTMPKCAEEAERCQLRNLPLLFPRKEGAVPGLAQEQEQAQVQRQALAVEMEAWDPTNDDWSVVESLYNNSQHTQQRVYDQTRTFYGVRDLNATVPDNGEGGGGEGGGGEGGGGGGRNGDGGGPADGPADGPAAGHADGLADGHADGHQNNNNMSPSDGTNGRSRPSSSQNRGPDPGSEVGEHDREGSTSGKNDEESLFVDDDDDDAAYNHLPTPVTPEAGPFGHSGPTRNRTASAPVTYPPAQPLETPGAGLCRLVQSEVDAAGLDFNSTSPLPPQVTSQAILQPHPTAALNANYGQPVSSDQKRSLEHTDTANAKRQKVSETYNTQDPDSRAPRPLHVPKHPANAPASKQSSVARPNDARFEEMVRDLLGPMTAYSSISPLFNPLHNQIGQQRLVHGQGHIGQS